MSYIVDASGNNNKGRLNTPIPALVTSPTAGFGNAISLDGAQRFDRSQGPYAIRFALPQTAYTVEVKIQTAATIDGNDRIILSRFALNGAAGQRQFQLKIIGATKKVRVEAFDTSAALRSVDSTTVLAVSTVYNLAVTYDGTTLRLFVNGVLEGNFSFVPEGGVSTTDSFTAGFSVVGGSVPFQGVMDEVRVSNVARYTANYTVATSPFTTDANTLLLWKMEAIYGTQQRVLRTTLVTGSVYQISTAYGTAGTNNTTVAFATGGVASTGRWNPTQTVAPNGPPPAANSAATNTGWRDAVADNANDQVTFESTASGYPAWVIRGEVLKDGETIAATKEVQITAVVFVVTSAGVSTEIWRAASGIVALASANSSFGAWQLGASSLPATVVPAGGKIQVELYVANIVAGSPTAPAAAINYKLLLEATNTVYNAARFIETPEIATQFARATSDIAPAVDTGVKSTILNRATTDNAPATDLATSKNTFPRATTDTAPAVDTAARIFTGVRATTDTALAVDTTTRQMTQSRATADTAPATDTNARQQILTRAATDTAPAVDVVTRTKTAPRSLADTAPAVDTVTRAITQVRSIADTAPATDAVARLITQVRKTGDNIGPNATDFPITFGTRSISGVVRDLTGVPIVGATVKLFRQNDDRVVQTQLSAAGGVYTFTRDQFDPNSYYVLSYTVDGVPQQIHGVSDRDLTPA